MIPLTQNIPLDMPHAAVWAALILGIAYVLGKIFG